MSGETIFQTARTLCILGCGNLDTAILSGLLNDNKLDDGIKLPFTNFIATVGSQDSKSKLEQRFSQHEGKVNIFSREHNVGAIQPSDVIILGVDPSQVESLLLQQEIRDAFLKKLLVSLAAGWTTERLETCLFAATLPAPVDYQKPWIICALPNIAAVVSQSLTAITISEASLPTECLSLADSMFKKVGKTVHISPSLMDATVAIGGSTPAFFAVICDAMIDAAVAIGVPRDLAHTMVFQSMQGTATLLQSGIHPELLKDQGTSPEGCTIGGLMVMEEHAARGAVGKAVREAVTLSRLMTKGTEHINDTKH